MEPQRHRDTEKTRQREEESQEQQSKIFFSSLCHLWDEELKSLAGKLGRLLRDIVATIDEYGLKRRHLSKHKGDVDRFFEFLAGDVLRSEVAEGYRQRMLKCRNKLFTFLDHDGVPWNNNLAEHAVKHFANYREHVDGLFSENGLAEYLVLLSICVTCKYKGVNFLKFLLSGEKDIDVFCEARRKKRPMPVIQTHPEGVTLPRPSRNQTWDQDTIRICLEDGDYQALQPPRETTNSRKVEANPPVEGR